MLESKRVYWMMEMKCPTALCLAGAEFLYPLLPRRSITESKIMLQLAPLPAYFVYDGFHTDLNATLGYERVLKYSISTETCMDHLNLFSTPVSFVP